MRTASLDDQARGLRQMFARASFVPVVSNPHVAFGGVMLERLCAAFTERGASVLVVDAAERASEAGEMALVDLSQCVEALSDHVRYLAARGLPVRFVDASGSTESFLHAVAAAAPDCDVVLVHATPLELCRLFGSHRRGRDAAAAEPPPCPIVFADDRPSSVTHAYAAMKLVASRAGIVVFDLLIAAAPSSPRVERIAAKLASCADDFFGAVVRHWSRVDPAGDPADACEPALRQLAAARPTARPARRRANSANRTAGFVAGHAHP